MADYDWNEQAKRLLKSELVRRGITNEGLVTLLKSIGVKETKAGIDSKISRGTFSAAFLLQCLNAIGCNNFIAEVSTLKVAEPKVDYKSVRTRKKVSK